jgi:hypothetical protein
MPGELHFASLDVEDVETVFFELADKTQFSRRLALLPASVGNHVCAGSAPFLHKIKELVDA